jgi:hypothetical protein
MARYKAPMTTRTRHKKQARLRAQAASAGDPQQAPSHPGLDYLVKVIGGHVMLEGTNDGNIRAAGGETVRFRLQGAKGRGITVSVAKLAPNRVHGRRAATAKWPFVTAEPRWPQAEFVGRLRRPGLLGTAVYRCTVAVEGSGARPAVRIIVIDRS